MDFLEKLKQLGNKIKKVRRQEEQVDQELSNGSDWSSQDLSHLSEQEKQIIEEIEDIENDFLNLIGRNSGNIIDKAEDVLELEQLTLKECKDLSPVLGDPAYNIAEASSSGNSQNAESEAIEQIETIKSRLQSIEQQKKDILSDLGEDERDAIEFLVSIDQVENEVVWMEKLVSHLETEENNLEDIAEAIKDKKQYSDIKTEQQETQSIKEGLKQLEGRLEDIKSLKSRQQQLAGEAKEVRQDFVEEARKPFEAVSDNTDLSPILKQELQDLKPVIQRLSESSEALAESDPDPDGDGGTSRRGFIAGVAAGIGTLGFMGYQTREKAKEEIEEIREQNEREVRQSNDKRGEIKSGEILVDYITSRSEGERSMRVDYYNKSDRKMKLEIEYIIPEGLKLMDANILEGEIVSEKDNRCQIVLEISPGDYKYTQLEMKLLEGTPKKVEAILKTDSSQTPDQVEIPINNS